MGGLLLMEKICFREQHFYLPWFICTRCTDSIWAEGLNKLKISPWCRCNILLTKDLCYKFLFLLGHFFLIYWGSSKLELMLEELFWIKNNIYVENEGLKPWKGHVASHFGLKRTSKLKSNFIQSLLKIQILHLLRLRVPSSLRPVESPS